MRRVLLSLALAALGCHSAADAIHDAGGIDPVICHKMQRYLQACRDASGTFWICDDQSPVECMRVGEPAKIFAVKATPEQAL